VALSSVLLLVTLHPTQSCVELLIAARSVFAPPILFRYKVGRCVSKLLSADTALRAPGSLTLILAPSKRQAKETFAKAAHFYLATEEIVPPDSFRKIGMELANGSRIEALPGTEKTIRGFSGVNLLIVEEAARVADELYYAVRPMLAVSGGRLVMLSTPCGKRSVFHHEQAEGEGWERYEVPELAAEYRVRYLERPPLGTNALHRRGGQDRGAGEGVEREPRPRGGRYWGHNKANFHEKASPFRGCYEL
jgi:hypothetical protein